MLPDPGLICAVDSSEVRARRRRRCRNLLGGAANQFRENHMKFRNTIVLGLVAASSMTLAACKQEAKTEAAEPQVAESDPVAPVQTDVTKYVEDRQLLFDFVKSGGYKDYPVSDEKHPSIGPHDDVRVYYNQVVADSLTAGNAEHPAGSMIVKEQYKSGESELYGWSVSIKTHEAGDAGKGWYWIEFLDKNDINKVFPEEPGNGVTDCAACHTLGKDLIRSAFPKGK